MDHLIAYEGFVQTALAAMSESYVPLFAPHVNRRIGIDGTMQRPPYTIESGLAWVREMKQDGKNEVFAILKRSPSGQYSYIGHTGIHKIRWPNAIGESGTMISVPEGRGCGCGTEAKLLLLYHAFTALGLRKMSSRVKAFNAASLGHLLKCGYKIVGRRKEEDYHFGSFVDEILVEVFQDDFWPIWEMYRSRSELPTLTLEQRETIGKEVDLRGSGKEDMGPVPAPYAGVYMR